MPHVVDSIHSSGLLEVPIETCRGLEVPTKIDSESDKFLCVPWEGLQE